MKALLFAAAAFGLAPATAHAQLLGGGGGLGGTLGGSVGAGPIGTTVGQTNPTIRGSARSDGSQGVDRRGGRVRADRSASGSGSAASSQTANGPLGSVSSSLAGSGSASGSGSADAQLIGTDAVGSAAGRTTDRARGAAAATRERATGLAQTRPTLPAGAISGASGAAGNASGTFTTPLFAAAGSAAGNAQGAFAIEPGMPVMLPDGSKLGKVREVVSDQRGRVQALVVKAGKARQVIPASALAVQGDALIAAQGAGRAEAE